MAHIIQTRKRREKLVQSFLESKGIPTTVSPAKEYLVCLQDTQFPSIYKGHPQIVKVIPTSTEEASKMLELKMDAPTAIQNGATVTLQGGLYDGFTGVVNSINDTEATVHLMVFGKLVPATVPIDNLAATAIPDIWR